MKTCDECKHIEFFRSIEMSDCGKTFKNRYQQEAHNAHFAERTEQLEDWIDYAAECAYYEPAETKPIDWSEQ